MSIMTHNIDVVESAFADLNMAEEHGLKYQQIHRPLPPAVPPKNKAQPQVPCSAVVNSLREPSYSSMISLGPANTAMPTYSNIMSSNVRPVHKDYANLSMATPNSGPPLMKPSSYVDKKMFAANQSRPLPLKPNVFNATYSNLPPYHVKDDDLPPPPPPPPPVKYDPNQNHDEYLPPPSPVSSNYSELVRATANLNYHEDRTTYPPLYQNEYPVYGPSQSTTYESLYEPINPRPHSNFSAQTNNSLQSYGKNPPNIIKAPLPKEDEVDALTNLLVKSISDSQDIDTFGTCMRCNEKVGETSGCTAMGNVYHIKCFYCQHCHINLQGKPFYAVEGHPYCETDYYETLEKCSVCDMPILDRILRATGKPYHPSCFTCVMCGKSLDGIPFTVDAMNQIHCIEDFHKKFAPRCCVCELPIMPEDGEEETVRVVALDRSFHVRCYRCEDCGLLLTSEAEGRGCYPLDDHILCKNCNAHRVRLLTNVMTTDL